jgi:hypothetical protein
VETPLDKFSQSLKLNKELSFDMAISQQHHQREASNYH